MQLQGGFQYNYAVFDEVHSLDGEEGGALQRLMHLIECPFLALSATIGNADELSAFWSQMRTTHKDCVPALIAPESPNDPNVALTRHEGRFINLQRYYLTPSTAEPGALVRSVDMAKTTSLEQIVFRNEADDLKILNDKIIFQVKKWILGNKNAI